MNNILVTGAAGFIGSHLVSDLLAAGCTVTAVDNFDEFYPKSIKWPNILRHLGNPRFQFVEADIRNLPEMRRHLSGAYHVIVHLAAKAGVRPSIENPSAYQQTNVAGTQNMLELARESKVPHFVFASSSSVYGVNPNVPWSESDNVLLPISPYASTKVSGELLGHVYSHLYGIRFVALRFFTVYGPRQRPDLAIHKFSSLISSGRPIPIFGDGGTRRDYTYVSDITAGIISAMRYTLTPFEIFNLGNDKPVSLLDLVHEIGLAMGRKPDLKFLPMQPGDVPQTWASIHKARAKLAYNPQITLQQGLRRFAAWLRTQHECSPESTLA